MELARREGYMFGAKLVRGAYMEQERARASSLGYDDPIHPSYKATSKCFDEVMNAVLEETKRGNANVLVATHNENSIQVAIKRYVGANKTVNLNNTRNIWNLCPPQPRAAGSIVCYWSGIRERSIYLIRVACQ